MRRNSRTLEMHTYKPTTLEERLYEARLRVMADNLPAFAEVSLAESSPLSQGGRAYYDSPKNASARRRRALATNALNFMEHIARELELAYAKVRATYEAEQQQRKHERRQREAERRQRRREQRRSIEVEVLPPAAEPRLLPPAVKLPQMATFVDPLAELERVGAEQVRA